MFKINKYEAAIRQLDYAIEAHFAENDIVCVATLTGASLELFRGLAAYKKKRGPWDEIFINHNGLSDKQYNDAVRILPNYFKHADRDAEVALEFDVAQVEMLMFCAVNTAPAVIYLTPRQFVFGAWFVARNLLPAYPGIEGDFVSAAKKMFPSLSSLSDAEQRAAGLSVVRGDFSKYMPLKDAVDRGFTEKYGPLMISLYEKAQAAKVGKTQ